MKHAAGKPNETIEAMRYLWAMVGVSAGVIETVDCQTSPAGEQLTCRNKTSGALISVARRRPWTEEEERRYVHALDRALNEADETEAVEARRERAVARATESAAHVLVGAQQA